MNRQHQLHGRSSDDVSARAEGGRTPPRALGRVVTPVRLVTARGGTQWIVIVVARLVSDNVDTGAGDAARLILRLECLTHPGRPARFATVRADGLEELDDKALRTLASGRGRLPSGGCRAEWGECSAAGEGETRQGAGCC